MKKFVILLLAVLATGCNLDEKLYNYVDEDGFIVDAASANNVLLGMYRQLGTNSLYGYYLSIIYDLPTDIAKVDGHQNVNNRDICLNAHTPSHAYLLSTWGAAYKEIYYANDFMERVAKARPGMTEADQQKVDVYVAEARTLRALMYFELTRLFGDIALLTTTEESHRHPSTFEQIPSAQIYDFVETELREAAEALPWAMQDAVRDDNSFMVSRESALGILARALVTRAGEPLKDASKWREAADVCRRIIKEGGHSLLKNYEDLWRNVCNGVWDPTESLFQISFYSPTLSSNSSQNNSGYIGKWNGVYVVTNTSPLVRVDARYRALPTFMGSWKDYDKDLRWSLSAADYYYDGTTKKSISTYSNKDISFEKAMADGAQTGYRQPFKDGLYVAKYDLTKYVPMDKQISEGNYSNANWYLLRYADVLLMYAEALNEADGAPADSAYAAVNAVRRRGFGLPENDASGVADLPAGMTQAQFRQAIRDERAYELCFEGQRKQDLIRWGIYYDSVMNTYNSLEGWREGFGAYYLAGEFTICGRHEIQPIPQTELDLMKKFKQNPGWE